MPISSKIYDLTLGTVAENGNGCGHGCGYFFYRNPCNTDKWDLVLWCKRADEAIRLKVLTNLTL